MTTMQFASLIKTARERAGLSQPQAAEQWEIPLPTLRAWEQGVNKPGAKHLAKLLPFLAAPAAARPSRSNRKRP